MSTISPWAPFAMSKSVSILLITITFIPLARRTCGGMSLHLHLPLSFLCISNVYFLMFGESASLDHVLCITDEEPFTRVLTPFMNSCFIPYSADPVFRCYKWCLVPLWRVEINDWSSWISNNHPPEHLYVFIANHPLSKIVEEFFPYFIAKYVLFLQDHNIHEFLVYLSA